MKRFFRMQLSLMLAAALCCASFMPSAAYARSEGFAPQKAAAAEDITAPEALQPAEAPKSGTLTLDPTSMTVPVFSGYFGVRIHAYIDGVEQSPFDITWTSSSSYVASVDNVGCVYASSTGTTTITARTQSGRTATCTVTVVSNSSFPKVNSINYTQVNELSYVNNRVSIGPLCGGEPVIIRRF